MQLEKMLEMNTLFAYYGELLTPRQQEFMSDYYQEDFTLQEIADNNDISRQAVSDSIRKAEDALKDFEDKLHVIQETRSRRYLLDQLKRYIEKNYPDDQELNHLLTQLIQNKELDKGE